MRIVQSLKSNRNSIFDHSLSLKGLHNKAQGQRQSLGPLG